MRFIDYSGLTQSADPHAYAKALSLDGEPITSESERLNLLRRLVTGSGVEVITGPIGAWWWSYASPEVKVRVVPDDTDFEYRTTDLHEWAYYAAGCTEAEAKELLGRYQPPTEKHRLHDKHTEAMRLLYTMQSLGEASPLVVEQYAVEVVHDPAEQLAFLDSLNEFVCLDFEWDVEDDNSAIGLAVSNAERNWYLPVRYHNYASGHGQQLREAFSRLLKRRVPSVYHNAKADIQTQYVGDPVELSGLPIEDTLVMAYLAGESELALATLGKKILGQEFSKQMREDLSKYPLDMAARYACGDSRATYDLFWHLKRRLEAINQWGVYESLERPLVPVIASMEKYGSPLDIEELRRLRTEIGYAEAGIRALAWERWHRDISVDDETRALVTDLLGYDPGTLDQRTLSLVSDGWMDVILGYRKLRTLDRNFLTRYIARWNEVGCPDDFRLYASFNQAGKSDTLTGRSFKRAPRTGRLSSSNPNLMQVPREVRSAFTAPEGCVYWALDFSQLEIRLAAAFSEDEIMLASLSEKGGDIHGAMRDRIKAELGIDVGRPVAKNANFNLRYGGTGDMLMKILAKERAMLTKQTAEAIVDIDRKTYAGYWKWYEREVALARQRGYSETIRGRRSYYEDLNSPDPYMRSHAERAAANHIIQGSAADVVKEAMVRAVPVLRHFGAHLSVQVHDELAGWITEENAEPFKQAMLTVMQGIDVQRVGLLAEGGYGRSWSEAKSA